jgi:hypothetical protein
MTRVSPAVRKEFRALLPVWATAMTIIVFGRFAASGWLSGLGLLGFAFGSIVLGAQSMGHEYSHKTLTLLLSQPVRRRRTFQIKALVLFIMVVTLGASTLVLFPDTLSRVPSTQGASGIFVVAFVYGLCLAPWLTMLCGSAMAGTVFTIAVPGLLATATEFAGIIYGLAEPAVLDRFVAWAFWTATAACCVTSAVASWRTFNRLEASDGGYAEIQLPGASPRPTLETARLRRQSPWRAIFVKELRLQQMAFVIAALFAVFWLGTAVRPGPMEDLLLPATFLYAGILAPIIGTMTSAQERQLGTLEWQTLLPVAAWRKWLVKVGVAWLLAVTFGVALPVALAYVTGPRLAMHWVSSLTFMVVGLAAAGVYMSSICRTTVTALVLTFPAIFVLVVLFRLIVDQLATVSANAPAMRSVRVAALGAVNMETLLFAIVVGLSALLVFLASINHRQLDLAPRRLVAQAIAILGYMMAAVVVMFLKG